MRGALTDWLWSECLSGHLDPYQLDACWLDALPPSALLLCNVGTVSGVQINRRYLQGVDWSQVMGNRYQRSVGWCPTTALLLACCSVLYLVQTEARSFKTRTSRVSNFERRLESVALPAGSATEGWKLGRASYDGPPDSFSKNFQERQVGSNNSCTGVLLSRVTI